MKSQQDVVTELLAEGVTSILLDARQPGVSVPPALRGDLDLVLNFSYRYAPADLQVNAWGIRQTLTFAGEPFKVAVPWLAIHGCSRGRLVHRWERPAEPPLSHAFRFPVARA